MTIAREEIFGLVLSAISFSSSTGRRSVIANDTIYGLSAGIWTDDVNVAHRAARAIRAGIVWVNTFDAENITSLSGGFKQTASGATSRSMRSTSSRIHSDLDRFEGLGPQSDPDT